MEVCRVIYTYANPIAHRKSLASETPSNMGKVRERSIQRMYMSKIVYRVQGSCIIRRVLIINPPLWLFPHNSRQLVHLCLTRPPQVRPALSGANRYDRDHQIPWFIPWYDSVPGDARIYEGSFQAECLDTRSCLQDLHRGAHKRHHVVVGMVFKWALL